MQLTFETIVASAPDAVWGKFDKNLFLELAPPLPRIKLLQFDGCQVGNRVVVELNFIFFKQQWVSLITEQDQAEDEIYFVDEGERLPFFLKYWRHRHRLIRTDQGTKIVDAIEYRSPLRILDWLLYPSLWLQFAYRRPVYRRVFGAPNDQSQPIRPDDE